MESYIPGDGLGKWKKPTANSIKINIDAATSPEIGCKCFAFVARDSAGDFVGAGACCRDGVVQSEVLRLLD